MTIDHFDQVSPLKSLFTRKYFAVAVSQSKPKPTQTFTVLHEKSGT